MAEYDETKLTKLGHLKKLAQKIKSDYTTKAEFGQLQSKVEGLVSSGGEPNVIEKIKVNGKDQTVTPGDKSVDIMVPTKVSQLSNDEGFQKDTEVQAAIKTAISAAGHASFEKAESVPDAQTAKDNVLYLIMNDNTGHYDIYAKVGGEVVQLDDTTVKLDEYSKTEEITKLLANKVDKDGSKKLSTEDYTTAEKTKLAGMEIAGDEEVEAMLDEVFTE